MTSMPRRNPDTLPQRTFWDLCEGPHVESTAEIPKNCFSLDSLAGAYWKGSEKNKMLQRVYGLAFESQEALKDFKEKRKWRWNVTIAN